MYRHRVTIWIAFSLCGWSGVAHISKWEFIRWWFGWYGCYTSIRKLERVLPPSCYIFLHKPYRRLHRQLCYTASHSNYAPRFACSEWRWKFYEWIVEWMCVKCSAKVKVKVDSRSASPAVCILCRCCCCCCCHWWRTLSPCTHTFTHPRLCVACIWGLGVDSISMTRTTTTYVSKAFIFTSANTQCTGTPEEQQGILARIFWLFHWSMKFTRDAEMSIWCDSAIFLCLFFRLNHFIVHIMLNFQMGGEWNGFDLHFKRNFVSVFFQRNEREYTKEREEKKTCRPAAGKTTEHNIATSSTHTRNAKHIVCVGRRWLDIMGRKS